MSPRSMAVLAAIFSSSFLSSNASALTVKLSKEAQRRLQDIRTMGTQPLSLEALAKLDAPLNDPSPYIRCAAIRSLGELLKQVTGVVRSANQPPVFLTAVSETFELTRPLEKLIGKTRDPADAVRVQATATLQEITFLLSPEQFAALTPLVRDSDKNTRLNSVGIMGKAPRPFGNKIREALEAALLDPDADIQHAAIKGLLQDASPAAFAQLRQLAAQAQSEQWRSIALADIFDDVGRLGARGAPAQDALITSLSNPQPMVVYSAAAALAQVAPNDPATIEALTKARESAAPALRSAIGQVLDKMGKPARPNASAGKP